MLKKDIESIFKAIRKNDLDSVRKLVEEKPELVNVCRSTPPKNDDGQSPLQIAFKICNFEIANFLIESGADINFSEKSEINEGSRPVIHWCIGAVILTAGAEGYYESGFPILEKIIEKGISVNTEDSYGNNCLMRAYLDTRQSPIFSGYDDKEFINKLRQVFKLLIDNGADPNVGTETRESIIEFDSCQKLKLKDYKLF